ncbi:hypothetical protein MUN82_04475 [Hymenobacter aerilatus]|uniref:Magnesium citrate secondary transporter n=1 Tax=Hymenobacter aerilatus TaxID=2932251 RepID=A0A8T9T048_9BACT|nr:hypothetical protein [Hymenobacter aerilatus]UOR06353.1 hypothetical protein MUN82_04475 [Hymenobacter aerilatus]
MGLRSGPRRLLLMGGVLLYAVLYLNRHIWHYPLPSWLSSHGADLLAMPILLSLTLAVQRRLFPQFRKLVLPDSWLLGAWLAVSVWFEGVLPYFSAVAVGDPLDVAAYGVGTLAFRRWFNWAEQ